MSNKREYSIEEKNTLCRFTSKRTQNAFNKLSTPEERRRFIIRHGKDNCWGSEILNTKTMEVKFSPKIGNLTFCLWEFKTAKEAKDKAVELYDNFKNKYDEQ